MARPPRARWPAPGARPQPSSQPAARPVRRPLKQRAFCMPPRRCRALQPHRTAAAAHGRGRSQRSSRRTFSMFFLEAALRRCPLLFALSLPLFFHQRPPDPCLATNHHSACAPPQLMQHPDQSRGGGVELRRRSGVGAWSAWQHCGEASVAAAAVQVAWAARRPLADCFNPIAAFPLLGSLARPAAQLPDRRPPLFVFPSPL